MVENNRTIKMVNIHTKDRLKDMAASLSRKFRELQQKAKSSKNGEKESKIFIKKSVSQGKEPE